MLCTLTQVLQMLHSACKGKDRGWGVRTGARGAVVTVRVTTLGWWPTSLTLRLSWLECEWHFYFIENLFILSVHIYIPDGVNDMLCAMVGHSWYYGLQKHAVHLD